jgi:hypothetical protein
MGTELQHEATPRGSGHRNEKTFPDDRPAADRSLLRVGALMGVVGIVLQVVMGFLHPAHADPNDSAAAFREYAHSEHWTSIHIGQFIGTLLIVLALVSLARGLSHQPGIAGAFAVVGGVTAVLVAGVFAVQMAVDGVALKGTFDAWTSATSAADKTAAFGVADGISRNREGPQRVLPPPQRSDAAHAGRVHGPRSRLPPMARLGRRGRWHWFPRRRLDHRTHRLLLAGRYRPPRSAPPDGGVPRRERCAGVAERLRNKIGPNPVVACRRGDGHHRIVSCPLSIDCRGRCPASRTGRLSRP